jgi:methyl-accepting chemotaxis protein
MEGLIKEGKIRESDGLTDDPRYWEQIKILCDIRRIEPRAYPYTYLIGEKKNELIFITSWGWCLDGATSDDYATFKQPIEFSRVDANIAAMEKTVFQTDKSFCSPEDPGCLPDIYTDQYGSWVSAYAPIKNSKGETVAGLGVDFTAIYVNQVQKNVLEKIYLAFAVTYIILLALVYFVAQVLTRPMVGLTRAAQRIGDGDYEVGLKHLEDLDLSEKYPDEIGTMERVFRSMVDKVYKREQVLRQQVQELKIEIDQAKRQKQVGEIVESEFFQELRAKAQKMRQQQSGDKPAETQK